MGDYGYVILAAGESSRFNGAKQLAKVNDKELLINHSVNQLPALTDDIYVVLGARAQAIKSSITSRCHLIINDHWQEGIASAIRLAVEHLHTRYNHLLISLADQVALDAQHFLQLEKTSRTSKNKIICASYASSLGVPAIFPSLFFDDLIQLKGDMGAKKIIHAHRANTIAIDIPEAAIDIDTKYQLEQWRSSSTKNSQNNTPYIFPSMTNTRASNL